MNAVHTRRAIRQQQRLLLEWHRQGRSVRWIARQLNIAPETARKTLQELLQLVPADNPNSLEPSLNDPPPGFDPANIRRCRTCG